MNIKKKVGVLTYHNAINYGAILQAYALTKYLNKSGYDACVIDYRQYNLVNKAEHKFFSKSRSIKQNLSHFIKYYLFRLSVGKEKGIRNFIQKFIPISKESVNKLSELNDVYDAIIVGSDQIWNPAYTGNIIDNNYLIDGYKHSCKKIAYAASAGSYIFTTSQQIQLREKLSDFYAIGVREGALLTQLSGFLKQELSVVLDPTFLVSHREWLEIASITNYSKYVLVYTFDSNPLCFEIASKIAKERDLKVIAINTRLTKNKGVDVQIGDASPEDFIGLFNNADFIVTNSFHGTAFSINFKKSFLSIRKDSNPGRVQELLLRLGLEDYLVTKESALNTLKFPIDYSKSMRRLETEIEGSKDFLRINLAAEF